MPAIEARLLKMLAHYEQTAHAIRTVLDMLAISPARNGQPGKPIAPPDIQKALQLDADRRLVKRQQRDRAAGRRQQAPRGSGVAKLRIQRQRSADFLSQFDPQVPKTQANLPIKIRSMGSLVRRGYLKPKGDGWIRTAKPYDVSRKGDRP